MSNKNIKESGRKKQSFFTSLCSVWKGLKKPTLKQLTVSTFRVVMIAVVSAVAISVIDIGFTQVVLYVTKLF